MQSLLLLMLPNKLSCVHLTKHSKNLVIWVIKRQTLKATIISTESRIIKSTSFCDGGSLQDDRPLKAAFPPQENWFKNVAVKVDLGYAGIINNYLCKRIAIPPKKTKNNPLTDTQKDENTRRASVRLKVEPSMAGMKRYRILSDRLRNHFIDLYNPILGDCAALWIFYLAEWVFNISLDLDMINLY